MRKRPRIGRLSWRLGCTNAPTQFLRRVANPAIAFVIKYLGVAPQGAHILQVRRRSGGTQSVPVNPLDFGGQRYLVAQRGNTEWARSLRAAGEAELRVGSRVDGLTWTEIPDAEKAPVLRAYLERWGSTTKSQFGVDASASEAELVRIALDHPVFRLSSR